MKGKSKFRNTLLAMLLSLAMVVTYMPAWLITYAENDISEQPVSELNEENAAVNSAADETGDTGGTSDTGEIVNDSGDAGQTWANPNADNTYHPESWPTSSLPQKPKAPNL